MKNRVSKFKGFREKQPHYSAPFRVRQLYGGMAIDRGNRTYSRRAGKVAPPLPGVSPLATMGRFAETFMAAFKAAFAYEDRQRERKAARQPKEGRGA